MSKAGEFIRKHQMGYETIKLEEQIDIYLKEMRKGLDGETSSLLMLPSYIELKDEVMLEKPVLCVDAGGTNLRITAVWFDAESNFRTREIVRYIMPGVEKELTADEFFDVMAELIAPFCEITKDIVISFAYRASTLSNIDCEIIEITKEVKVLGAQGRRLAKEVALSLDKLGVSDANIIVINDSVATALSGKAERLKCGYGTFTGTILGTGSNSCYIERNANIGKVAGLDKNGVMVINTEAGSYDKMPRSDIDRAFDAKLQNPGIGVAEKMTSGGYLGALCAFTLKWAASEGVFNTKAVEELCVLPTAEVSQFLEDGSGVVAEYMVDDEDAENARELLQNIVLRAARMAALQMAAMAEKACKTNNRICMTIEGTTYDKMFGLKEELLLCLHEFSRGRGYEVDVIEVDLAVLKGCAIAGLSRRID